MIRFLIIDFLRNTTIVNSYFRIARLMKLDANEQIDIQRKNLVSFLIALKKNRFFSGYIKNYSKIEIKEKPVDILKELPITDKELIKNNFEGIFNKSNLFNYENTYTGGSTGSPFNYVIDKKSISYLRAFNYYLWTKFLGYKLGDRIIVISGNSLGSESGLRKKIYNFLQNKTFISGDKISLSNAQKLVNLINISKMGIYIYGYPSSIYEYTKLVKNDVIKTCYVKGVITTSEMLSENIKALIEEFFKTKVLNVYGANDGGIISCSMDNKEFQYNGHYCYIEEFRENGVTELLLTNLNSRVFPFVRYKVGDCANIATSICDYPFTLTNLAGRSRDFLINSSNEKLHGSLINKILKPYKNISQYQVVQEKNLDCTLLLRTHDNVIDHSLDKAIVKDLKTLLGNEIRIKIEYKSSFILSHNGKHKLVISHAN